MLTNIPKPIVSLAAASSQSALSRSQVNKAGQIQLASGKWMSQTQKLGNNTESVKILGADSRITTEQRESLYKQALSGDYNPTGLKINYRERWQEYNSDAWNRNKSSKS